MSELKNDKRPEGKKTRKKNELLVFHVSFTTLKRTRVYCYELNSDKFGRKLITGSRVDTPPQRIQSLFPPRTRGHVEFFARARSYSSFRELRHAVITSVVRRRSRRPRRASRVLHDFIPSDVRHEIKTFLPRAITSGPRPIRRTGCTGYRLTDKTRHFPQKRTVSLTRFLRRLLSKIRFWTLRVSRERRRCLSRRLNKKTSTYARLVFIPSRRRNNVKLSERTPAMGRNGVLDQFFFFTNPRV